MNLNITLITALTVWLSLATFTPLTATPRYFSEPVPYADLRGYARYHQAANVARRGRNAAAVHELDSWRGDKKLEPFVTYNLGVALLASGQEARGIEVLQQLVERQRGGLTTGSSAKGYTLGAHPVESDPVILALIDKAHLELGKHYLQQGLPVLSASQFSKVNPHGALGPLALLGAGWAHYRQGHYAEAIVPWQALANVDADDDVGNPAVQEGFLLLADAFERAGYPLRAAKAYRRTLIVLEKRLAGATGEKETETLLKARFRAQFSLAQVYDQLALKAQRAGQ